MPPYFIAFLAMLAASVLLFLGALAMAAIARRPPPRLVRGGAVGPLQAVGVALLWSSVGVGWLLYFNVYRIHVDMSALGNAAFQAFSTGYTRRLPIVVLPYGATCLVWTLALWSAPGRISRRALWAIATLQIVSLVSTPWAAGAQDAMQAQGYTEEAYRQLQNSHLVRTLAVTLAAVWAHVETWRVPQARSRAG